MAETPANQRPNQSHGQDAASRARSVLLAVLSVEIAVLIVTGIALLFVYRPTAGQAWPGLVAENHDWNVRLADGLRLVHRLASWLAVPTAIVAGVVIAVCRGKNIRRWPGVTLGTGIAVTTLLATFTGFLLPWDQLALYAVKVGSNLQGYRPLFDSGVRFVLVRGNEVSPDTVLGWLFIHALVLGPSLVGLVAFGWRRYRIDSSAGTKKVPNLTGAVRGSPER